LLVARSLYLICCCTHACFVGLLPRGLELLHQLCVCAEQRSTGELESRVVGAQLGIAGNSSEVSVLLRACRSSAQCTLSMRCCGFLLLAAYPELKSK
jgi:hypothetical protein